MRKPGAPEPAFGSDFDCALGGLFRGPYALFDRRVVHAPTMTPPAPDIASVERPFPKGERK